jgi:hypothetical protein
MLDNNSKNIDKSDGNSANLNKNQNQGNDQLSDDMKHTDKMVCSIKLGKNH